MSYLDVVVGPPIFRFALFQFHIVIWACMANLVHTSQPLPYKIAIVLSTVFFFLVAIGDASSYSSWPKRSPF